MNKILRILHNDIQAAPGVCFTFTDVNECLINVGLCVNGRCRNTEGSFVCECADGYTLTPDGEQCRDINECSEVRQLIS